MDTIDVNNLDGLIDLDFNKVLKDAFIDVNLPIDKPPSAVSIGEMQLGQTIYTRDFGTYGNFSCITGASKAKKTFLKSLIVSAYIGGNSNEYAPDILGHRKTDKYVLDFDTEQSRWHSQRVFKRVGKINGENYNNYKPFYLRKYDYKERLAFIDWCIMSKDSPFHGNIGFVNIDGFADLVADVNDLTSCNELVAKMLKWTDVSQCHLTGILHKNFGTSKPTGHLGSAILKKAETVCMLDVDENDKNYTNVSFPYTRGFNIEDFSFRIDEYGLPRVGDKNSLF